MSMMPRCLLLVLIIAGGTTRCYATEEKSFTTWLNDTIVQQVKVAVSSRSNSNQAEAPSVAGNSSTLVDTSSASDLIGVALNIAGLTSSSTGASTESDATTATATASAYTLYSALRGVDPLDPANYCGAGPLGNANYWRRLSFTLGLDDNKDNSQKSPIIAGAKVVLWTERDVCSEDFSAVQKALEQATQKASELTVRIQDQLYDLYNKGQLGIKLPDVDSIATDERQRKIAFINNLGDKKVFTKVLNSLAANPEKTLLAAGDIEAFVALNEAARANIDAFRGQPQLSASFQTKQREMQADDYRAEAIFDYGLNDRLTLSVNGSYEATHAPEGKNEQGGRVAAAFQMEPFRDPLFGPKPLRFSFGGEGKWMEGIAPIYKGQLKVNLPIPRLAWLAGFEVPLSVSIANRSELIDETEVRGLIGFTVDTSQVLAAVQR